LRHSPLLTLHCTRKLLKHLHAVVRADSLHSTTCLGDWYANLLLTERLRLFICVSERSLLPVFVVVEDPASFVPRLKAASNQFSNALEFRMRRHSTLPSVS
jgi:hypothetical protein